ACRTLARGRVALLAGRPDEAPFAVRADENDTTGGARWTPAWRGHGQKVGITAVGWIDARLTRAVLINGNHSAAIGSGDHSLFSPCWLAIQAIGRRRSVVVDDRVRVARVYGLSGDERGEIGSGCNLRRGGNAGIARRRTRLRIVDDLGCCRSCGS